MANIVRWTFQISPKNQYHQPQYCIARRWEISLSKSSAYKPIHTSLDHVLSLIRTVQRIKCGKDWENVFVAKGGFALFLVFVPPVPWGGGGGKGSGCKASTAIVQDWGRASIQPVSLSTARIHILTSPSALEKGERCREWHVTVYRS